MDPFSGYNQMQSYSTYLADSIEAAYQSHQQHLVHQHQMSRTTESKPRLSKEEVEILEAEFQKNHKPNSSTKKALAESMRVDNARINNWFQNRRAREKKENNIRAYEARQKFEKEKSDAAPGSASDDDTQREFVASSAPFPEPQKPLHLTKAFAESSPASSLSNSPSETVPSTADEQDCISSQVSASGHPADDMTASDSDCLSPKLEEHLHSTTQLGDFLEASVPMSSMQGYGSLDSRQGKTGEYLLDSYQPFVGDDGSAGLRQSFSTPSFAGEHGFLDNGVLQDPSQFQETLEQEAGFSPESDLGADMQLKTPPVMDIASRRNRRPPPLSINGARTSSYSVPKTAVDLSKSRQFGNTMRRVASVNGMVRIAKPSSAAPRSPFTERKAEGLLYLNRSPNMNGPRSSIAPPTPNTPIVSAHLGVDDASFSLNDKLPFSHMANQDPTLRTPPTTPGIMDQLFNLNSAYESSLTDEPLATPGLGRFPGEFEMPDMPATVPGYLASDCTSQPETPLYAPNMGPAYFGYSGGNAEYNWSEANASARSSPGQTAQRMQFMNMTASNFS
jgi:hypothetical protein